MRRVETFPVLVERDHGVVQCLGERDASVHGGQIRAFRKKPLRLRVDAGFFEQCGKPHPGPFGARKEAVDRLHVGLNWVLGEQRRAVASAFDKADARHHRIAREGIERKDQGLLNETMDHQAVLVGVDVGKPTAGDHEVQAVRRDGAVEQMVRRACLTVARLVFGIGEGPHDVLLVFRRSLVWRNGSADLEAPRIDCQRLGTRAG